MIRKLEAEFDHRRMVWEYVMSQVLRLDHLAVRQEILAHGEVTREMYESLGEQQVRSIIERQLDMELDRFEDALLAYDEAYGESEDQDVGRRQESR